MHLFGLNWQLQESEGYGAFENGGGGRDTTPNTFMVSTDNGEFLFKHIFCPFFKQENNIMYKSWQQVFVPFYTIFRPEMFMTQCFPDITICYS